MSALVTDTTDPRRQGARDRSRRPRGTATTPGDRRAPVARYVVFRDEDVQTRFVTTSEAEYQRLLAADRFAGLAHVELSGAERVPATPALAMVARSVAGVPEELGSHPTRCAAAHRVAQVLAEVAGELVGDLAPLAPAEQGEHPAYRQTLRLGAELESLRSTSTEVDCTPPEACVALRAPERWGRRLEDVEVSEVRAVLLRLSAADTAGPEADPAP